MSSYLNGYLMS